MKNNIAIVLFVLTINIFSIENSIILGRDDNWKDMRVMNNLELKKGKESFQDIYIAAKEHESDSDADLILHFNDNSAQDAAGHYYTEESSYEAYSNALFGKASALFEKEDKGIVLHPSEKGSVFSNYPDSGDFSIEFWLLPYSLEEGSFILQWKGYIKRHEKLIKQALNVYISDRKLVWDFRNFFVNLQGSKDFTLKGSRDLYIKETHHHLLRYNNALGLLEYLIDGKTESIIYTTKTAMEDPMIFQPATIRSSSGPLIIASSFTGLMDEFRITKKCIESSVFRKYKNQNAFALSRLVDFGMNNSQLVDIIFKDDAPDNSDIFYYYYISDSTAYLDENDERWIPCNKINKDLKGRYLQLKMELFSNGKGDISPYVSEIKIVYEKDVAPMPPDTINISAGDKELDVSWSFVAENDVKGYLVYYGTESSYYFGKDASEGSSPIDVGNNNNIRLSGLENGQLYYVSIVAYDSSIPGHKSAFSREVSARPSKIYKGSK